MESLRARVVEELVSERAFDAFTRHAADAVSRRTSLLALGGSALAASLAEPVTAKKKVATDKQNAKKQVKKKCRRQVRACQTFFSGFCSGIPECEEEFFPCCDSLAQCDAAGMLTCLFSCGCGGMPTEYEQG
jgi:hypothetical protein